MACEGSVQAVSVRGGCGAHHCYAGRSSAWRVAPDGNGALAVLYMLQEKVRYGASYAPPGTITLHRQVLEHMLDDEQVGCRLVGWVGAGRRFRSQWPPAA